MATALPGSPPLSKPQCASIGAGAGVIAQPAQQPAAALLGYHLSKKLTKARSLHIPCSSQQGDTPALVSATSGPSVGTRTRQPCRLPVGHVFGKGDARMRLLHESSDETVSWGLWKEYDQEVLAFRARPMQGAHPCPDNTGNAVPGLATKPWSWAAGTLEPFTCQSKAGQPLWKSRTGYTSCTETSSRAGEPAVEKKCIILALWGGQSKPGNLSQIHNNAIAGS